MAARKKRRTASIESHIVASRRGRADGEAGPAEPAVPLALDEIAEGERVAEGRGGDEGEERLEEGEDHARG
jgi:hypothetical protein